MLLFVLEITPRHACLLPAIWLALPLINYKLAFNSPAYVLLSSSTVNMLLITFSILTFKSEITCLYLDFFQQYHYQNLQLTLYYSEVKKELIKNILPTSELDLLYEWNILIAFIFFNKQVLLYWFGFAFLRFCVYVQTKLLAIFGT